MDNAFSDKEQAIWCCTLFLGCMPKASFILFCISLVSSMTLLYDFSSRVFLRKYSVVECSTLQVYKKIVNDLKKLVTLRR